VVQLKRFGKYEIIRKLGRSMTDVYIALDSSANSPVVLKLIELSRDHLTQVVVEAERRGAQIQKQLHQLDHRILEIYDFGEYNGCFYVAMEYFEGQTIAEILQTTGRLAPKLAVRYTVEALSQLSRLHSFVSDVDGRQHAVVHGDIKPSNIQIGSNEQVRLLDFGIAKTITYTRNLTRHDLGSPVYCSPERLAKGQVDAQADLWAVGVSLYEMISACHPYQAQSTRKLENLIQSRRPPRALPADCPIALHAVLAKALAADVKRRYLSAEEFETDLRAFLEDRPTMAEVEKLPSWDSNATLRKDTPEAILPAPPLNPPQMDRLIWVRKEMGSVAIGVAAGFLCGMLTLLPAAVWYEFQTESSPIRSGAAYADKDIARIDADWNLFQKLQRKNALWGTLSPVSWLSRNFQTKLLATADGILAAYQYSSDPVLTNFDWSTARASLAYALSLDPSDQAARGKLALCEGYINLIQNPKLPGAEQSIANFQMAATRLPQSPIPQLALARVYAYALRNVGQVLGHFSEAERRGFRLGPREFEQQADAFLFRGEYELRQAQRAPAFSAAEEERWLKQAANDFDRARNLYEPIAGFSNVSASLDQLYQDGAAERQLRLKLAQRDARTKPLARRKQIVSSTYGRY